MSYTYLVLFDEGLHVFSEVDTEAPQDTVTLGISPEAGDPGICGPVSQGPAMMIPRYGYE